MSVSSSMGYAANNDLDICLKDFYIFELAATFLQKRKANLSNSDVEQCPLFVAFNAKTRFTEC